MAALVSSDDRGRGSVERLEARIGMLEQSVASLGELAVRAYEQTPAAAASLFRLRRSPTYMDAYTHLVSVRIEAGTSCSIGHCDP